MSVETKGSICRVYPRREEWLYLWFTAIHLLHILTKCMTNIFSHSLACGLTHLSVSLDEENIPGVA